MIRRSQKDSLSDPDADRVGVVVPVPKSQRPIYNGEDNVLLDADTLELLDQQVARLPTRMPYIPGFLSFRELPALLEALAKGCNADVIVYLGCGERGNEMAGVLDDLQAETMDRFGPLPDPAKNLFRIARLRVVANPLDIERMDLGTASGSVAFGDATPLDPGSLILLLQKSNRTMRFDGPKKIRVTGKWEDTEERFSAAQRLLDELTRCVPRH